LKNIKGRPDIFIEPNIVIFSDGCWWHGCEKCYNRNKFNIRQLKSKIRDIFIIAKLIENDYKVLRFWEHDINNNFEEVLDEIIFAINERKIKDKIGV